MNIISEISVHFYEYFGENLKFIQAGDFMDKPIENTDSRCKKHSVPKD